MRGTVVSGVLVALVLAAGLAGQVSAEETITCDFTKPLPDSWQAIGGTWSAGDGVLKQGTDGGRLKLMTDITLTEGSIAVEATVITSASFGIVGHYVEDDEWLQLRHGAYTYINLMVPGLKDDFIIGCNRPKPGDKLKIKLVFKRGVVAYVVGDTVVTVLNNALAGKPFRAGLYTENPVEFRDLKIVRTK